MDANVALVAEKIMGFERKFCQGIYGCANISSNSISDGWIMCDWCGLTRDYNEVTPRCPKYPFPRFSFLDLMQRLGQEGIPISIRYDTIRTDNHFTIIGPEGRICNTDTPFEDFCAYLVEQYKLKGTEMATVEVKKVSIKIGKKEIELSLEEAKELKQVLNDTFGKERVVTVPSSPIIIERPVRRPWPYYPQPYIYWSIKYSDNTMYVSNVGEGTSVTYTDAP